MAVALFKDCNAAFWNAPLERVRTEGRAVALSCEHPGTSLKEQAARAAGIAAQRRQTILEIDNALMRMESGHYGVSEDSGEPIPYKRLLIVPWAKKSAGDA